MIGHRVVHYETLVLLCYPYIQYQYHTTIITTILTATFHSTWSHVHSVALTKTQAEVANQDKVMQFVDNLIKK